MTLHKHEEKEEPKHSGHHYTHAPVPHPPAPAHQAKKGPKHKVGAKVKVGGREGEVTEAVEMSGEYFYSVRCPKAGAGDHTHDTLGAVREAHVEGA